jgi:HTH-type transcriptional regulator/antitoxin MqsA
MKIHGGICPVCGEGHLHPQVGENKVEYKGQKRALVTYYSTCGVCGSEQACAQQVRDNKRVMLAFKKEVDGLLTGEQIKALRARLGITQAQAAIIFGGGPVAFSKYESDDISQSEAMDKLLRLVDDMPNAFSHLVSISGALVGLPINPVEYVSNGDGIKQEPVSSGVKRPLLRIISSSRPERNNNPEYVKSEPALRYGT